MIRGFVECIFSNLVEGKSYGSQSKRAKFLSTELVNTKNAHFEVIPCRKYLLILQSNLPTKLDNNREAMTSQKINREIVG